MGVPTTEELQIALKEAAHLREHDQDAHFMGKALLNHNHRIKQLEKVMHAAELYLRSGNAGHEHTLLVRAIETAKNASSNTTDHDELEHGL